MGTPTRRLIYDTPAAFPMAKIAGRSRHPDHRRDTCPHRWLDLPLDFERGGRGRLDGGLRSDRRLRRGPLHAGHGIERDALLSQRVLRQVRALSYGLAKDGRDAEGLDRRAQLEGRRADSRRTFEAMRLASICGLGQVVPVPIASVLKHFPGGHRGPSGSASLPGRRLLHASGGAMSPDGTARPDRSSRRSTLTIDGRPVAVPAGHDDFRCRAHERHPDPHAVPSAKRKSGGRLPRLRGGCGRTRVYAASCIRAGGSRHGGEDQHRAGAGRRQADSAGTADGRPSLPCARQQHSRRLRTGNAGAQRRTSSIRVSPSAARPADTTTLLWPSRSITRPAFSATAAFAAATRFAHNLVLARRGKGYQAGIAFDHNCPWGIPRASPAGSAWCPAPPAR